MRQRAMADTTSSTPAASVQQGLDDAADQAGRHLYLQADEVDTIGKSIAFLVQEILLNGFDSVDHKDLAARIALVLEAMPSARPLILGMQFSIFEENYMDALTQAHLLVEREHALMEMARARQAQGGSHR